MASILGERLGERVGYRVRHESAVSKNTRVLVVTEGVLTRRLLRDPALRGVGTIVFDEFHERSVDADLCLALARRLQTTRRDDLRLILMSATLGDTLTTDLSALLGGCPSLVSEGRTCR